MEQAEEKKELTLVQKLRKIYAQLKVFKSKMVNEDFRQFRTLEEGGTHKTGYRDSSSRTYKV